MQSRVKHPVCGAMWSWTMLHKSRHGTRYDETRQRVFWEKVKIFLHTNYPHRGHYPFLYLLIIVQNSKIIWSCSKLLLSANTVQIVSLKICKNKNKEVSKAFTSPFWAWHYLHHKVQQLREKLECSDFIILAKPRRKQRIISRWCPFLYRLFNSTLFWNLQSSEYRAAPILCKNLVVG